MLSNTNMNIETKYKEFLTSKDLLRIYEGNKKFCEFCNTVFDAFGFLVKEYNFLVEYEGGRGWGINFKKDFISIIAFYACDEIKPLFWISREDPTTYAQKGLEELMREIDYKASKYSYTENYNSFSFIKWLFFGAIYKFIYKKKIRNEFYLRITESGNFVNNYYSEIIKVIDDPKSRVRKTYTGYYSELIK